MLQFAPSPSVFPLRHAQHMLAASSGVSDCETRCVWNTRRISGVNEVVTKGGIWGDFCPAEKQLMQQTF